MAFKTLYTYNKTIFGETWEVTIEEDTAASVTSSDIDIVSIEYDCGFNPTKNIDIIKPIRPTRGSINIYDPDRDVYNYFANLNDSNGVYEGKFKVTIEYNSIVFFVGFLRPEQFTTNLIEKNNVINLPFYDGLGLLKNIEWTETGRKLMNAFFYLVFDNLDLGIDTEISWDWEHDGSYFFTVSGSNYLPGSIKVLAERVSYDDNPNCLDVLKEVCLKFGLVVFQSRGEWYVMQRNLRSDSLLTLYGISSDGSTNTIRSLTQRKNLGESDIDLQGTERFLNPLTDCKIQFLYDLDEYEDTSTAINHSFRFINETGISNYDSYEKIFDFGDEPDLPSPPAETGLYYRTSASVDDETGDWVSTQSPVGGTVKSEERLSGMIATQFDRYTKVFDFRYSFYEDDIWPYHSIRLTVDSTNYDLDIIRWKSDNLLDGMIDVTAYEVRKTLLDADTEEFLADDP
ncbi:hypothetical protein [Gracilimonas sediminicola]|uniref:Uncharacterized protein n=1 Tax=Gracilimonas sediminicola TaxID=2952158 RepID=A0A9X2L0A5_9BACT|nr:hypothetical protein [Gracilimonas sediminicola]MCP9289981.1 hypothetical protein [Gracilimonas sediminicola]